MRVEPAPKVLRAPAAARSSPLARALGAACLGAAALALTKAARAAKAPAPLPESRVAQAGAPWPGDAAAGAAGGHAARSLHRAAAVLALSVLADSGLEHYRGQFGNPGMFAPMLVALATLAAAGRAAAPRPAGRLVYATALATGAAGAAFHAYNVWRRPGGFCWQNLFYAAPLGAPAALGLAGAYGLAAQQLAAPGQCPPTVLGMPAGRALSALSGIAMAGTAAEAGLLHFRGAFHRPAMWLPVTLPPIAAALLLRASRGTARALAHAFLGATALLGVAGVAFHASGIHRQMGGWRNWRQNVLSGPPLPAPPSFLALALAGRAALALRR